jgi:hypothetical protein
VRRLLRLGADPSITDTEFGSTPLGWARHAHHDEVAVFLEPRTPEPSEVSTG